MTGQTPRLDTYLDLATAGFADVVRMMLGWSTADSAQRDGSVSAGVTALVPIVLNDRSVYVGIGGCTEGSKVVARAFLGLEPDDDDPTEEDIDDAVGELANMTAGRVQSGLTQSGTPKLGLPIVTRGDVTSILDEYSVRVVLVQGAAVAVTVALGLREVECTLTNQEYP